MRSPYLDGNRGEHGARGGARHTQGHKHVRLHGHPSAHQGRVQGQVNRVLKKLNFKKCKGYYLM
jgi:hypothetical protein